MSESGAKLEHDYHEALANNIVQELLHRRKLHDQEHKSATSAQTPRTHAQLTPRKATSGLKGLASKVRVAHVVYSLILSFFRILFNVRTIKICFHALYPRYVFIFITLLAMDIQHLLS